MSRHRITSIVLAGSALLAACVPPVGDYSEFAVHGKNRAGVTMRASDSAVAFAEGRYQGALRDGLPNGEGTLAFNNGKWHRGTFIDGRMHGPGETHYPDGRVIRAEYQNDAAQRGEIVYADGRRFEGQIHDGQPSGSGTMSMPSGEVLTARFRNGAAEGFGLLEGAGGKALYAGTFRDGEPHGEGLCAGPGGATACFKDNGRDITRQALEREAAQRAEQEINRSFDKERSSIEREYKPQIAEARRQIDSTEAQARAWAGPSNGDDCYCELTGMCLLLEDADATREERALADIAWQKSKLECRRRYADYLGNKSRPDYSAEVARLNAKAAQVRQHHADLRAAEKRRADAVEASRQRMLADDQARKRLQQEQFARSEQERTARLEADKARCAAGGIKTSPCRCRVLLQLPAPKTKGGACEA